MQHSIFVTVEEFTANGGIIESGRNLFRDSELVGWYDYANDFVNLPKDEFISVTQHGKYFPAYTNSIQVEIEVTPIYK